jgi:thiamine-monophosphate kinase
MGAEPAWFTLALTLPHSDEDWLADFSRGLSELADKAGVQLVGGDTTRGPLTVTIQVAGYVPTGEALLRRGAKPGEEIWVSGTVGDAALGLQIQQQSVDIVSADRQFLLQRLNYPQPRHRLGMALRHLASSCIDVSDGLIADLAHLCAMSRVGASIDYEAVPLSGAVRQAIALHSDYRELPLYGGDDYELCFTAPGERHEELLSLGQQLEIPLSCIGVVTVDPQLQCRDRHGEILTLSKQGYQHFGDTNS